MKSLEDDINLINKRTKLKGDIPLALVGLLRELCNDKPQYYWKRDVADEVSLLLENLFKENADYINKGLEISSIELFESIRAYENITKIITEIRDVSFEESFKTRIFRNPIFAQICEDFLMNLYRVLRNIINESSDKDYSNQNTLTPIIQCLSKHGFVKSTNINVNLRNAVNHGNVFVVGNQINYRYGKPSDYENKKINYWEYDSIIDETFDISCGILVGILRTLAKYPEIIVNHADYSEENSFGWLRLTYRNTNLKIISFTKGEIDSPQLNINVETSLEDKNNLIVALIEIAKGMYMNFPNYERYLVGYNHDRSPVGFIRLTNKQLSKSKDVAELYKMLIESKDVLMFDIMNDDININAFKYHIFPKIKTKSYEVLDTKNISISGFKRIKANLILTERISKKKIKPILVNIINKISNFETPQDPYMDTAFGSDKADVVLINVFINNPDRKKFNLFPNNHSFVGTVQYYKNEKCPRLENGGVMESLWKSYKKEKLKNNNILIAWNPNY
jgi:hypothetical protein